MIQVSSIYEKGEILRNTRPNMLKSTSYFYDNFGRRDVDLRKDAHYAWNILKADVVRDFEPALRQYFNAECGKGFTSGIYFYSNTDTYITKKFLLPKRSSNNGYADMYIRAFQDGAVSPVGYNVSLFTTVQNNKFSISNENRLVSFYKLDYAIFVMSLGTIAIVDVQKARLNANLFTREERYNNLKKESFYAYVLDLDKIDENCIDILGYDSVLNEYRINSQEYIIEQNKGYTKKRIPTEIYVENMPKTKKLYNIYNFRNEKVFTLNLNEFATKLTSVINKQLNLELKANRLYERIKAQIRRAEDKDFVEVYIKESDNTYILTPFMYKDEDVKEFQLRINQYKCKLHGISAYVKKADRPRVELERLIKSTRSIKPEDTLTNQDLTELDLQVLQHKNSKTLSKEIKPTTEFIYGGVCKDEETSERNNKKYLPAFFNFEVDNYGLETQRLLLDRALHSKYKDSVFFATFSGKKSLHITVWIDPCYRALVSQNYKAYWKQTAEKIFGVSECFDSQCASIAHPARIPNGIRYLDEENKYVIQSCWYLNKKPTGIQVDKIEEVKKHHTIKTIYSNTSDIEKVKHNGSESGRIAYDVIVNNNLPSGMNYFSGLMSLFKMNVSKDFIQSEYFDKVKKSHPTSLGLKTLNEYWTKYKN